MIEEKRTYLGYMILTLAAVVLLELIMKMSGSKSLWLSLSDHIVSLALFVFAALWKRNRALVYGLILYLVNINIQVFKDLLRAYATGSYSVKNLSYVAFVCLTLYLVLFFIGMFLKGDNGPFTKKILFKDSGLLLAVTGWSFLLQAVFCVYYFSGF